MGERKGRHQKPQVLEHTITADTLRKRQSRRRLPLEVRVALAEHPELKGELKTLFEQHADTSLTFSRIERSLPDTREALQRVAFANGGLEAVTVNALTSPIPEIQASVQGREEDIQAVQGEMRKFISVTSATEEGHALADKLSDALSADRRSYARHRLKADRTAEEEKSISAITGIFALAVGTATGLRFLGQDGWGLFAAGSLDDIAGIAGVIASRKRDAGTWIDRIKSNKATLALTAVALGVAAFLDNKILPGHLRESGLVTRGVSSVGYWFTATAGSLVADGVDIWNSWTILKALNEQGKIPGQTKKLGNVKLLGMALGENFSNPYRKWLGIGILGSLGLSILAGETGYLGADNPLGDAGNGITQASIGPIENISAMFGSRLLNESIYRATRNGGLRRRLIKANIKNTLDTLSHAVRPARKTQE